MKRETILIQIQKLICEVFDFSFSINNDLAFFISYNNGKGKAKILIGNSLAGIKGFVQDLSRHPNCTGHEIAPAFHALIKDDAVAELERLKIEIEKKKASALRLFGKGRGMAWGRATKADEKRSDEIARMEARIIALERSTKTESAIVAALDSVDHYKITDRFIYFSLDDFKAVEKRKGLKVGRIITSELLPGIEIVRHEKIGNCRFSLLYRGQLLEFRIRILGNNIQDVLDMILEEGVNKILEEAKEATLQQIAA